MKRLIVAIVPLALLGAGCNQKDADNVQRDASHLAQSAGEAIGNMGLGGKVATVLSLRKGVDMSGLHIDARDQTVTLSGHVRTPEEHKTVLDTVNGIRGVDTVLDHLTIENPDVHSSQ